MKNNMFLRLTYLQKQSEEELLSEKVVTFLNLSRCHSRSQHMGWIQEFMSCSLPSIRTAQHRQHWNPCESCVEPLLGHAEVGGDSRKLLHRQDWDRGKTFLNLLHFHDYKTNILHPDWENKIYVCISMCIERDWLLQP